MYIEVFDSYGHDNSLIARAAKTCYASEAFSKRTDDEFVTMLKSNSHLSMLEFQWIVVKMRIAGATAEERNLVTTNVYHNFISDPFFQVYSEEADIYIGGNARAWYDYFLKKQEALLDYDCVILTEFKRKFKVIFDDLKSGIGHPRYHLWILNEMTILDLIQPLRDKFHWVMLKACDVSRGLTAEFNRHRLLSTAEMSTRYVNLSDFKITLVPPDFAVDEAQNRLIKIWKDLTTHLYSSYSDRDIARQFLPLATNVNIVKAGTLEQWKQIFSLRCSDKAHWEIKSLCEMIQKEFQKRKLI